jgi:hypothetical protein
VQRCFETHAKQIEGQPQVTIRFSVAESGQVNSAELSPSSLAGTSLGQCLLGIARSTSFGKLEEAVVFSIPITAKRVTQ